LKKGHLDYWLGWALLALLVAMAWAGGLHGEFTYDDKVEVIGNRTIRLLEDWESVLEYNLARPILIFSYAINFRFARFDPYTYHLFDLLLQMVNAGLSMLVVARGAKIAGVERYLGAGVLAAGIWALHPLATESVSYITGRSEQLCGTFYLLSCWGWLRWLDLGGRWRWVGAHVAFLLAALSKEVAATLPVALVLLELYAARGGRLKDVRWRSYAAFALLLAAAAAARVHYFDGLIPRESDRGWSVQLWTEAEVAWRYVQLAVVPWGQSVFHDHHEAGLTLRSGAAALGLVAATGAALAGLVGGRGGDTGRLAGFAWLWFLLLLAPSSVVPLKETMAEHRTYLALLGPAWLAGAALAPLARRRQIGAALFGILAALTWHRNTLWVSEVDLWADAVERNRESPEAWYGLGEAHRFAQDCTSAIAAYAQSSALDPSLMDAWNNRAICQATTGRMEEAEATLREALIRSPTNVRSHTNLGLIYARTGRFQEAELELRTALTYNGQYCQAHYWIAVLYQDRLNRPEDAERHLRYLIEDICPGFPLLEDARRRHLELTF